MPAWGRFWYGVFGTVALMMGGLMYSEVFVGALLPVVPTDGPFGTPVVWLERLVPVILVGMLLFLWAWVLAGGVQEERTVQRRRL